MYVRSVVFWSFETHQWGGGFESSGARSETAWCLIQIFLPIERSHD